MIQFKAAEILPAPFFKPKGYSRLLMICFMTLFNYLAFSQVVISGKVTDGGNNDPIPYCNVYLKGSTKGTTTDFDGKYSITIPQGVKGDSLSASCMGYKAKSKLIIQTGKITINFQLAGSDLTTSEVVIKPGENPAWAIMRGVTINKDRNDRRNLKNFSYESYNKIEVDIDNLTDRFKKKRFMRKIGKVLDSLKAIAGEDGKPILPIFVSEAISDYYYNNNPVKTHEEIKKSKITGIGMDDGSIITQMVGSSFQQYNFYENWLIILNKSFVSPIADGWKFSYEYELKDSLLIGNDFCYRIECTPKRAQDLAFTGTIWITKGDFALKQIDVVVNASANLNFISKIKMQQELAKTTAGPWLPVKNRMVIDVAEFNKNWAGMLAKFYTSNRNIKVNIEVPKGIYDNPISEATDVADSDDKYWKQNRHDTLTPTEASVFKMIDTIKNLPVVRSYIEIANIFVNGYKRVGKLDYGPYLLTYANNNIEGSRLRLGLRTNSYFNKRITFEGYGAYGTKDGIFKYGADLSYIISRKKWTIVGIIQSEDLDQVALLDNSLASNKLFVAFTRFGNINGNRPFMHRQSGVYLSSNYTKGLTQTLDIRNRRLTFNPDNIFYQQTPDILPDVNVSNFTVTEVSFSTRYSKNEVFINNPTTNKRTTVNSSRVPVYTFTYILGIPGIGGNQLQYNKFNLNINQQITVGIFGIGRYTVDAGIIPNTLPYPLLRSHLGNNTFIYNSSSFNTMKLFEFVSDKWLSVGYQQNFEGFLLNSIPYVAKAKLRLVGQAKLLFGSISKANETLTLTPNGASPFKALNPHVPYVEVGYGVENIFRFIRIDVLHRLTYLQNTKALPITVLLGFQFKL